MNSRLTKPLKKIDNQFVPIDFDETFHLIAQKLQSDKSNATLVFADGSLSTEELYLIQRLARAGFQSNALGSFEFLEKKNLICYDKNDIVPFSELAIASHLFFLGFQPNDALLDFQKVKTIIEKHQLSFSFLDQDFFDTSFDYFTFFRAINHYILKNNKAFGIFIQGFGKNYETYKEAVLQENFDHLLVQIGISKKELIAIVETIMGEELPVLVFREKYFTSCAMQEIVNFAMLIQIQAQTGSGIIPIKEEQNSQGLLDMGIHPLLAPGGENWSNENIEMAQSLWNSPVNHDFIDVEERIKQNYFQQLFIFGNNKVPEEFSPYLTSIPFKVVQTFSLDKSVDWANLLLPVSLAEETGGLFTDSTRMPHTITATSLSPIELSNIEQISRIGKHLGLKPLTNPIDIFLEFSSFFHAGCKSAARHFFKV